MIRWALCFSTLTLAACGVEVPASELKTSAATLATARSTNPDAGCPTTWYEARQLCVETVVHGLTCTNVGLTCSYPGPGDGLSDGTYATVILCRCGAQPSQAQPPQRSATVPDLPPEVAQLAVEVPS
jgi:hypothetical protein